MQVDEKILSYLYLVVIDHGTPIQIRQFIEIIIDQIIKDNYSHIQKYFQQTLDLIAEHDKNNFFFQKITASILLTFVVYLSIAFLLFFVTLPIVRKVKTKIKEIYRLLSKISLTEKNKYYRHFKQLQLQFRKNNTSHEDFSNYLNRYDSNALKGKSPENKGSSEDSGDDLFNQAKS